MVAIEEQNLAGKYEEQRAKLRSGEEAPAKYLLHGQKFMRRKFELYGQESLDRAELLDSLQRNGLMIVEGFWDVLRLRQLGIASVGITRSCRPRSFDRSADLVGENVRRAIMLPHSRHETTTYP